MVLVSQAYQLIDKKNVYTEATKDKTFQYSFLSDFAIEQRRRRKKSNNEGYYNSCSFECSQFDCSVLFSFQNKINVESINYSYSNFIGKY